MAKKAQPKRKKVARKGASKQSRRAVSAKKVAKSASKKTKKVAKKKTKKSARTAAARKKVKRSTAGKKKVSARKAPAKKKVKGNKKSKTKVKKTTKVAEKATSKKKKLTQKAASKNTKARAKRTSAPGTIWIRSTPKKRALRAASSTNNVKSKSNARATRTNAESPTSQDPIRFPDEHRKTPKTYLTAKQLREFKELLLQKRRELSGDVDHLTRDAYSKNARGGEYSAMPIHMADIGTDNWEHEFTLGLIENEQERIREIDAALARVRAKTYGMCLATHKKISVLRLRAKPWAKYCIEHALAREEGRLR